MYIEELGYEVKMADIAFKDIDTKKGIVVGYFAGFGNEDSDGDIIPNGAFTKTIKEQGPKSAKPRIKHFIDHNKSRVPAVIQELDQDSDGLRYESKAGRDTEGRDWLYKCEDGIITEHSIGFETINSEKQKSGANLLTEIKLWEGSSLHAWGSNYLTPVVGVKSFKQFKYDELSSRFDLLEKAIRNGKYTDETFVQLEKELKTIKHLLHILTLDSTQPGPNEDSTKPGETQKDDEVLLELKQFITTELFN
jgi:HK97 family phage prohead protease